MSSATLHRVVLHLSIIFVCAPVCQGGILDFGQHKHEGDDAYESNRSFQHEQAIIEFPALDEMTSSERAANRQRARKVATIIEKSLHMLADDILQMWAITRTEKAGNEDIEVDDDAEAEDKLGDGEDETPDNNGGMPTKGTGTEATETGGAETTEEIRPKTTERGGVDSNEGAGTETTKGVESRITKVAGAETSVGVVSGTTEEVRAAEATKVTVDDLTNGEEDKKTNRTDAKAIGLTEENIIEKEEDKAFEEKLTEERNGPKTTKGTEVKITNGEDAGTAQQDEGAKATEGTRGGDNIKSGAMKTVGINTNITEGLDTETAYNEKISPAAEENVQTIHASQSVEIDVSKETSTVILGVSRPGTFIKSEGSTVLKV